MRIDVFTLFPKIFDGFLEESILGKARQRGLVSIELHNFRDWATGPHNQVDDRPYGGGPGMVMMVEPIVRAVESVLAQSDPEPSDPEPSDPEPSDSEPKRVEPGLADNRGRELVMLTPAGRQLDQLQVERWAQHRQLLLMCGRYEGFDQRISDILQPTEISIGDYVLNGGESAAMVIIDAVVRLLPGVLGDEQSSLQDSFAGGRGWLEYPQYTRPAEFRGHAVPDILTSGDHRAIAEWREAESRRRTEQRQAE